MKPYLLGLTLLAGLARAQAPATLPGLTNAQLETRRGQSPADAVRSVTATAWIGYTVPAVRPAGQGVCTSQLEKESMHLETGRVLLEGSPLLAVLARVTGGAVERITSVPAGCTVDAGGLPVIWLEPVPGAESVRWLSSLSGEPSRRGTLHALARHAEPSATAVLARRAENGEEDTYFWLGQSRGAEGLRLLERIAFDPSTSEHRRRKAVFAISRSPEPAALALLRRAAATEPEALLWLAHRGGPEARAAILESAERNPEKAMLALSQLKEGGVDLLIDQARHGKTPEIRRKAVFWISRSRDPRASAFLTELLR